MYKFINKKGIKTLFEPWILWTRRLDIYTFEEVEFLF